MLKSFQIINRLINLKKNKLWKAQNMYMDTQTERL
jgi:hypothetical protein